ncbi:MAG: hypothetical protein JJU12_00260 [Chlamydiales bacterium]|nr:hypothetical protein [Chlamydiales bacterium]
MKTNRACGHSLNPWNYQPTPARKAVAAGIVGLAAIGIVAGVFLILASSGSHPHALNASMLPLQSGAWLSISSLLIGTLSTAWLLSTSCPRKSQESLFETYEPKKEESLLETYEPLEQLKKERVGLLPPLKTEEAAPIPKSFQFLEDLKRQLPEPTLHISENTLAPKKEIQIQNQREAFLLNLKGHVTMLLQGHIDIEQTLYQDAVVLEGELSHPAQVSMVLEFAQERIAAFNQLEDVTPIDWAEIEAFKSIALEAEEWNKLLELERRPIIDGDALTSLAAIQAPVHLKPQFQAALRRLVDKPTNEPEAAAALFTTLGERFEIKDLPSPLSPAEPFVKKLKEDIQSLFQYKSQEEDEVPPLKLKDINLIRQYIHEEERRFLEAYGIEVDVYSEFGNIEFLENTWGLMDQLASSTEELDPKIESLTEIANQLPASDSLIWPKYHVIRDCMARDFTDPFASSFFSTYTFNLPLNEEDQARKIQIDTAFVTMAEKFGCIVPENAVIIMNTESDAQLSIEAQLREILD